MQARGPNASLQHPQPLVQVHVFGHDWGAVISYLLCAKHPDKVASLTALAVPYLSIRSLERYPSQVRRSSARACAPPKSDVILILKDDEFDKGVRPLVAPDHG